MSRPSKVADVEILRYTEAYPTATSGEIAEHCGLSQSQVSKRLIALGVPRRRRGRQPKQCDKWEHLLVSAGLGMGRGAKVCGQRLFYGHDYADE
jgi:hypothetical protein